MTSLKGKIKIFAESSLFSFWSISGLCRICMRHLTCKKILHPEHNHYQPLSDISQIGVAFSCLCQMGTWMFLCTGTSRLKHLSFYSLYLFCLFFIQERESWSLAHVPRNNIRQPVMLPSKTKCCGNVLSDSQGHHF